MSEAIFVEGLAKTAPKAGRPALSRDRKPGRLCIGRFPGGAINHLLGDVRMHGDRASLAVLRLRRKTDRPLPRLIHVIPLKPEGVLIKPDTYKVGNPVASFILWERKRPPPHKRPDRIAPVGSGPCADRILHFLVRLSGKDDGPRCGDPMGRALGLPSAKGEQKSGIADIPGVVLDDPAGIHTIIRKQIARCLALRRKGGVHKPGGLAAVDHRPLKAPAHHRGPFLSGAPRRQDGNYAENNCQQAGGNSFSHVVISFFTWLFVI